jgi:hypothetical protein
MPRLLEELSAGTPVRDNTGAQVGEVRAVYGSGDGRGAEYILVYWTQRGEEALIPADEAMNVADDGVTLRQSGAAYGDRPAFDPSANPLIHRL